MTLTRPITLPPASPVGGGILDQAAGLPDGWERGVEFATEACIAAGEHVFCPDSPTLKQFQGSVLADFSPFGIEVSVQCTTLTGSRAEAEREARAFQALEAIDEFSVGYVLATGETQAGTDTGNPALLDATSAGSAATAVAALAIIEDAIGENLRGMQAWVHVTPSTLTALVDAGVVYRTDGPRWRTPTGHVVVASPGYVGILDGEIVATTPVYAERGEIERVDTVVVATNRRMAVHEAPAIAVFDPCFNVSVSFGTSP